MKDNNEEKRVGKKDRILFIGYNFSYPNAIKNTLKDANFICSTLFFDKNIELYLSRTKFDQFNPLFSKLKTKVSNGKYTKFALDVPNLRLHSSYNNTMEVINNS